MIHFNTFICGFICFLIIKFSEANILLELPEGTIRGKESVTVTNKTFYSFLKVPYASAPIGELRFKAPIPPKKWEGILDATSNHAVCYQVNRNLPLETEDCLYLNIYTPKLPTADADLLPVIFYIHGGGFIQGTCLESICGADFFMDYDVVVVTINYRLGPFGFLSTEDLAIPGNNGLKDQHLGIKWVHNNIEIFGGDPSKITLVGQSAGAASVAYQLLNPQSEGLFWGVICQSGSFLSPWSFQRNARDIAFKTAAFINETFKSSNNSEELKTFLLSVSATELDEASFQVHQLENLKNRQINQGYFYSPVLELDHENSFITRKMYGDLKSGNFVKVPIMIGITSEESLEDAADLETLTNNMKLYDEHLDWLVPDDLNIKDENKKKKVGELIRSFYTSSSFEDNSAAGIKYFSDTSFTRSVIKHAQLHSEYADVYFYQFSYDGMIGNFSVDFPGYDNTDMQQFPEDDILTHRRMMKLWSNFAKTLNPAPKKEELLDNILWVPFTGRDFSYLDIDKNLTLRNYPKIGTYLPWNIIYDVFGEEEFDTY